MTHYSRGIAARRQASLLLRCFVVSRIVRNGVGIDNDHTYILKQSHETEHIEGAIRTTAGTGTSAGGKRNLGARRLGKVCGLVSALAD